MNHANAPLTVEGRRRLVERCRTRPIAHVVAEMGIPRATASKWVTRHEQFGKLGLLDRSSTPLRQPAATASAIVTRIERMRREHKWSASRIEFELALEGVADSAERLLASCTNSASTDADSSTRTMTRTASRSGSLPSVPGIWMST